MGVTIQGFLELSKLAQEAGVGSDAGAAGADGREGVGKSETASRHEVGQHNAGTVQ